MASCYFCGRTEEEYMDYLIESLKNGDLKGAKEVIDESISEKIEAFNGEKERIKALKESMIELKKSEEYHRIKKISEIPIDKYGKFADWSYSDLLNAEKLGYPFTDDERAFLDSVVKYINGKKNTIGGLVSAAKRYLEDVEEKLNYEGSEPIDLDAERTVLFQQIAGVESFKAVKVNICQIPKKRVEKQKRDYSKPYSYVGSNSVDLIVHICPVCDKMYKLSVEQYNYYNDD